jgi:SAM-dependent methyltransferase
MENPWLTIPHADYEAHMLLVGQAQAIGILNKKALLDHQPESFALIGCSTGNGLEHLDHEITKRVYAIDINPVFLDVLYKRFGNKVPGLHTLCLDLQSDELDIEGIDLVFCALVLEYVSPPVVLEKLCRILSERGKLVIVIQKNHQVSFVSKTQYKSLESLADVAREVDERLVSDVCMGLGLALTARDSILLNNQKSLIVLEFSV